MSRRRRERGDRTTDGETASGEAGRAAAAENGLLEWVKSVAVAVVLFLLLRTFVIQTFVITSGSMEDTLLVGDFLIVNRAAIGTRIPGTDLRIPGYSRPERFDVIVFDPPHEPDLKLVKRLVGMPGDTLAMRDRVLFINGERVAEPYLKHQDVQDDYNPWMLWQKDYLAPGVDAADYEPSRDNWGPLVIPPDRFFMLGDNRETSLDSRYWGLLERWRLEGRASLIYYSYDQESYVVLAPLREIRWGRIGQAIR